jgi:hypothetical protein
VLDTFHYTATTSTANYVSRTFTGGPANLFTWTPSGLFAANTLQVKGSTSGTITLAAPAAPTSYSFILPSTSGTLNQLLSSTGSATEWTSAPTLASVSATDRINVGAGTGFGLRLTGGNLDPVGMGVINPIGGTSSAFVLDCNNITLSSGLLQGGTMLINSDPTQPVFSWYTRVTGAGKNALTDPAMQLLSDKRLLINYITTQGSNTAPLRISFQQVAGAKTLIRTGIPNPGAQGPGGVYINSYDLGDSTEFPPTTNYGGSTNIGHWNLSNCMFVAMNQEKYQSNFVNAEGIINVCTTFSNIRFMSFYKRETNTGLPDAEVGSIQFNPPGGTLYTQSSDYRIKENVVDHPSVKTLFQLLRPRQYSYISDVNHQMVSGFIAHEVQPLFPQAVVGEKDAVDQYGKPKLQQISNESMAPILAQGVKELFELVDTQQTTITTLESTITTLSATLASLTARIEALESV